MLCHTGTSEYRFSVLDPPQIVAASPAHGVLHVPSVVTGAPPLRIAVPQKHCDPNSTPARVNPLSAHAAWHLGTVFPETRTEVLSVRALVSSV
jgi:hypothetical protein